MGTYTDCSSGVCSMYCPRFCYIIFPPPPPFGQGRDGGGGGDPSGLEFSPLIVAVIGILVSAFILVCYYTIISKYCRRRGGISHNTSVELNENHHDLMNTDRSLQTSSASGLDEALIKTITAVCKYKKGDGLVEGTDCSVCLSEFEENESLRLLPKCNHAFHLPCIDAWLKSHSSCPLCRSNINATTTNSLPHQIQPLPQENTTPPPTINVSALEYHRHGNDTILVVQEEQPVVSLVSSTDHGMIPKTSSVSEIRRSVSLNYSFCHGRVLSVADILRANEDDEEYQRDHHHQVLDLVDSPGMNRSISTGRFMFTTRYGSSKGNNSIIPN